MACKSGQLFHFSQAPNWTLKGIFRQAETVENRHKKLSLKTNILLWLKMKILSSLELANMSMQTFGDKEFWENPNFGIEEGMLE